jgi:hypothetical protein
MGKTEGQQSRDTSFKVSNDVLLSDQSVFIILAQ